MVEALAVVLPWIFGYVVGFKMGRLREKAYRLERDFNAALNDGDAQADA